MRRLVLATLGAALTAGLAMGQAATPKLQIGDAAPALEIAHWIRGDAVEAFEPGKLYLIEFMSVRSAECRGRLRHLDEIRTRFAPAGLRVICVTGENMRNSREDVEKLVAARGDELGCSFAWDSGRRSTHAYMRAARRGKLPCTFLVDGEGKIAYIGRRWVELAIDGVLSGKWSREIAERDIAAAKLRLRETRAVIGARPATVDEQLDRLGKQYPYSLLTRIRQDAAFTAHLRTQSTKEASRVATEIIDDAVLAGDASRLNSVAWTIVDPRYQWKERDLDVALRAARSAVELTGEKNAAVLDTLARVWFWKQDFRKAWATQRKAVAAKDAVDTYRKTLDEYEAAMKGVE